MSILYIENTNWFCADGEAALAKDTNVPDVVHAHWVHGAHGPYCSNCDAYPPLSWRTNMTNETQFDYSRFCPTCGAVMDEEVDDV